MNIACKNILRRSVCKYNLELYIFAHTFGIEIHNRLQHYIGMRKIV